MEEFNVKLEFKDEGHMTIKKFDYEDNKQFLKRINKILKIFMKNDVSKQEGVTE